MPHRTEVDLVMTDRQAIEIDYCPQCRAAWIADAKMEILSR